MFRYIFGSFIPVSQLLIILCSSVSLTLSAAETPDSIDKDLLPRIEGSTLHIAGPIDDHIYDYIAYEYKAMKNVRFVSLTSYGGKHDWALLIAEKIKEMGLETQLREGNVCASACVYLFGAGRSRVAHASTWLGIHGARLGASALTSFLGTCFIDTEGGRTYIPSLKGCQDMVTENTERSTEATVEAFDFLEANGVSVNLRTTYLAKQDDPDWPYRANLFRKPDWILQAKDAKELQLVTEVSSKTSRFGPLQ